MGSHDRLFLANHIRVPPFPCMPCGFAFFYLCKQKACQILRAPLLASGRKEAMATQVVNFVLPHAASNSNCVVTNFHLA